MKVSEPDAREWVTRTFKRVGLSVDLEDPALSKLIETVRQGLEEAGFQSPIFELRGRRAETEEQT